MKYRGISSLGTAFVVCCAVVFCGCAGPKEEPKAEKIENYDITIGGLTNFYQTGETDVIGVGIVAGLAGTGSSQCPADLRETLVRFIQQQLKSDDTVEANQFIDSKNTAVVEVFGEISPLSRKGQSFDVMVAPVFSTQTTSLDGGHLFMTKMKPLSRLSFYDRQSPTMATAKGAIFVNKTSDAKNEKKYYVLGGGKVYDQPELSLVILQPNYFTAAAIRDQLNERFGKGTAVAPSPGEVFLKIPVKYRDEKAKFLEMVTTFYLSNDPGQRAKRMDRLIEDLVSGEDSVSAEIALETMGNPAVERLWELLDSDDERVRLQAGRCLLNIGDDKGLDVLRRIAEDKGSSRRGEAIKAIGTGANRRDAVNSLNKFLSVDDFDFRYGIYDQLRDIDNVSITKTAVAGEFMIDSIACDGPKVIFVTRAGKPRITIFGEPLYCKSDVFVSYDDGRVFINATPGSKFMSLARKQRGGKRLVGPVKSTFRVNDVISTLAEDSRYDSKRRVRPGLGLGYGDVIAILELMCKNGDINAEFVSGPMVDIELPVMGGTEIVETEAEKKREAKEVRKRE